MIKRRNFAKLKDIFQMPHMLDIQVKSFEDFLQADIARAKRKSQGLEHVFNEVFPIENSDGSFKFEFVSYSLEKAKYSILECQKRGVTYGSTLRVRLRL